MNDSPLVISGYSGMTPPDRIMWGTLLSVLIVGLPIGIPLVVMGVVQLHSPLWRVRTCTKWAARNPNEAAELLAQAEAIAPRSPEVTRSWATYYALIGDWPRAVPFLSEVSAAAPQDWTIRGAYAMALLKTGALDAAISELETLRSQADLTPDSRASVMAHLAYAYLCKEDPQVVVAMMHEEAKPLGKTGLGGCQCLFYLAVALYLEGNSTKAIATLDRLYALDPEHDGLDAAKTAMEAGRYELLLPDGSAIVPLSPAEAKSSVQRVNRRSASPHCQNCGALRGPADITCRYCAAVLPVS